MKFLIILLFILSACASNKNINENVGYVPSISSKQRNEIINDYEQFLQQLVYHGAVRDELSHEFVNTLINDNQLWVEKCNICSNVIEGLREYAKVAQGKGIPAPYSGAPIEEKKKFLKQMVNNYKEWFSSSIKMNKNQISSINHMLEGQRTRSMDKLVVDQFCASCDGACRK